MQHTTEIPREGWSRFFTRFSQDHEVMGSEVGAQFEGQSLLLSGISPSDPNMNAIAMSFDAVNGDHLTHIVNKPTHVWVLKAPDSTDEALEVEAADGTKTLVRFPPY